MRPKIFWRLRRALKESGPLGRPPQFLISSKESVPDPPANSYKAILKAPNFTVYISAVRYSDGGCVLGDPWCRYGAGYTRHPGSALDLPHLYSRLSDLTTVRCLLSRVRCGPRTGWPPEGPASTWVATVDYLHVRQDFSDTDYCRRGLTIVHCTKKLAVCSYLILYFRFCPRARAVGCCVGGP